MNSLERFLAKVIWDSHKNINNSVITKNSQRKLHLYKFL